MYMYMYVGMPYIMMMSVLQKIKGLTKELDFTFQEEDQLPGTVGNSEEKSNHREPMAT